MIQNPVAGLFTWSEWVPKPFLQSAQHGFPLKYWLKAIFLHEPLSWKVFFLLLSAFYSSFVSTYFVLPGYQTFVKFAEMKVNNSCQHCLKQRLWVSHRYRDVQKKRSVGGRLTGLQHCGCFLISKHWPHSIFSEKHVTQWHDKCVGFSAAGQDKVNKLLFYKGREEIENC